MGRSTIILALLVLAGVSAAGQVRAQFATDSEIAEEQPPRYAVELILFRYSSAAAAGNELFLPDAAPIEPGMSDDDAIPEFGDLAPTQPDPIVETDELDEIMLPTANVEFASTPRSELLLQDEYSKLQLLDAYEPVLWTGWTQDAVERDRSPTIPLRRIGNAPPAFDGNLQLYLNRFLHLVVEVTMTERSNAPGRAAPYADSINERPSPLVRLRINEDRIMKNGDLRYFDHPKFGLLVKVTRVEEADESDEESDAGVLAAE